MTSVNNFFPSKYLSKEDLRKPIQFTIEYIEKEMVKGEFGEKERMVIYFTDRNAKPFIVNRTNSKRIAKMYGDQVEDWEGKPLTLEFDRHVAFRGEEVGGIRVREEQAQEPYKEKGPMKPRGQVEMEESVPF